MIGLFAEAPALPLHTAGPYVAAAYIVFLLVVLVYVLIMARKLISNSRELRDLRAQLEERAATEVVDHTSGPNEASDSHYQFEMTEKAAGTADRSADE
jgi:hypothetical protein